MRIALVHSHLQGGGVTRIVCHQHQALSQRGIRTVTLVGKPPAVSDAGEYRVIPALQYEADRSPITAAELAKRLLTEARAALSGPPDLWHVHNHSLGKNLVLPLALRLLADQGQRLLLQIHDFAEDGRPGNYRTMLAGMAGADRDQLSHILYPQADHVHYAVLNRRDYRFLRESGLDTNHLHLLLNPVDLGQPAMERTVPACGANPLWLYPTRAIRRKNLGECLFWSALAPEGTWFGTTSGPENPVEWPRYHRWRQVAADLGLPVRFEMVQPGGPGFVDLLARADVAVTTSVAEGFGMAFLEPWVLGVPVFGRNLPEIMPRIGGEGVELPWTYERLDVPVEWLGRSRIEQAAREGLHRTLQAYGRSPRPGDVERVVNAWVVEDRVDFGRLDESMQETVLARLVALRDRNVPFGQDCLPEPAELRGSIAENRRLLRTRYTLAGYGAALEAVYQQMVGAAITGVGALNGEALLDRFLAPERLCLLRVD